MILLTGGLGFIGSHVTRALVELGEQCVVVQRRATPLPAEFGDQVVLEHVDVADRTAFLEIGRRHQITSIVNMVGVFGFSTLDPIADARLTMENLFNVLEAAREWEVPRVGTASTIGVYFGVTEHSPMREDMPLPMTSGHGIPAYKKIAELLTDHIDTMTDVEILNYRISGTWGPGGRPASPFMAAPGLVHAAVNGTTPDLAEPAYADDGLDMVYAKDCGRAIALLQVASRLKHRTYNVASGRATTNGEVLAAIKKVVPDARIELPAGSASNGANIYLDISRLQDTGYQPAYDTDRAVADYIDWLRAGNPR
ncbi:MAG: NAD(P)-dependent oxidoreductase [Kibdelosporangium sp.]